MMPMPAPPSGHPPAPAVAGPSATPLAPAPPPSVPVTAEDASQIDGRKAKRELSQSKRAAQNRAAQRAFRQRKEGYIKKLEQQVREYLEMERVFEALRTEYNLLRDYITQLQARLLEIHGDFPAPPPGVNLLLQASSSSGASAPPPPATAHEPPATTHPGAGTPLEAVAQAVAGLAAQEQIERHQSYPSPPFKAQQAEDDNRTTEEINRQLSAEQPSAQT
ncbi:putative transcription factor kapC [Escovopsis weberi]|uniref:Putative transcription factor kapC n=1 Tax=Escovopsis weberi TaxID=150374 RepID=A0A0M9VSM6_ESCWE|nr:putative transcription factor kapC [Escovopsis weberi]